MIITLTTDFGTSSPYVAQMKGVILSRNPAATIIDICHDIPPQDVRQGAIVLADTTGMFPRGTLHVAVVDPGVGTQRAIVYARVGDQSYIAPDNGLLSLVTRHIPADPIIALTRPEFWRTPVCATFHGRDIMAPAAAHLSLAAAPEDLGTPQSGLVTLDWPEVKVLPDRIVGTVLQIDSFGNLVSNITRAHLSQVPEGQLVRIACRGHAADHLADHYAQQAAGTLVALFGSSGRLELSVCRGNAARRLGATAGDEVEVTW